jgi:hypothetical protein
MEIVRSQRQLAAAGGGGGGGGLPTYRAAPQLEVRLEEFELFAIDRLRGAISSGSPLPGISLHFLPQIWSVYWCYAAHFFLLCSSQGDLGWALAREEAGGDGETGE